MRDPARDYLDVEPGEPFDQLIGASIHYRIAIGPNAGRQALTLRTVPALPETVASTLLAKQPGFSLHAATCCEANQRDKLEKLCRYIHCYGWSMYAFNAYTLILPGINVQFESVHGEGRSP
ncbi:MAG: hypothetical protein OXP09_09060 [Gammaproteobacteria bacterium]|nr:hypothetical protein [Gammaproteobacteria bacterium]